MRSLPACVSVATGALGFLLLGSGCSQDRSKAGGTAAAAPPKPVAVDAVAVSVRSAQRVLDATGTLQPYDKVTVSSEVDGSIKRVLADLGDRVSEGQLLAEVNPEEFKIQVEQQAARLQQSLAQLGLKEGQDPRSIRNEDTPEVRRATSILEEAETNYRRVSQLFKENIGTAQAVDQARAQWKSAQANLILTTQNIETVRAQIEQFRAALELARKKLKDTSIVAPLAGSISERQVSVGVYVKAQTPIFTIVQTDPLRLRAEVSERLAPSIRPNQPVQIKVDGFSGRLFPGTIWRISPAVSEQSRTLLIEALVANADQTLRPGMFARASIQSGEMAKALMIPAQAVLNFYGVNKVFCLSEGKAQDRTVKLGDRFADYFEVLEGVRDQELVAVSNLEKLSAGLAVEVKRADKP